MARPKLYTEEEIEKIMPMFPYWDRDDKKIVRELVGRDFINAVGMVTSIAIVAEKMDHHPDIFLYGYNKIRVTVTTGDQFHTARIAQSLRIKGDPHPNSPNPESAALPLLPQTLNRLIDTT
jgi:4a-hydroxytetrahydrobiopterin dehydratase